MMKLQVNTGLERAISVIDKYYEIVYIIIFALYYFTQITVLSSAPFFFVEFIERVVSLTLPIIVVTWLIRNLTFKKREVIIGLILIFIMTAVSLKNGYGELRYMAFFAAGSIGVNLKKVIKCTAITAGITILYTFLYTFAFNSRINSVYVHVNRVRSTMGLKYPTDAASFVLYLCFCLMILGKICPFIITFIFSCLSLFLSWFYFDSVTSSIISGLLCLAVIGVFLYEKKFYKFTVPQRLETMVQVAIYILIPFLTGLQLMLAYFYGKESSWAVMTDKLLHRRVMLTYKGLAEHGISLFGENYDMFGAAAPGIKSGTTYNFLDSSYVNIPVRYGLIAFVCILFMWFIIQRKAVKHRNGFIILATILISIHSYLEQHFAEIAFNSLLFLPFSYGFDKDGDADVLLNNKSNAKKMIMAAVVVLVITMLSPYIFSATRTIHDSMTHENVQDRLDADSKGVEIILDVNDYPVYADVLTGEYVRRFKEIKRSALSGDDLVRKFDCTIITDVHKDSPTFFSRGAAYARISDYSAVYTTDPAVIGALRDAGYHVAGYYYPEEHVDIRNRYSSDSIPISTKHVEISGEIEVDTFATVEGEVVKVTFYSTDGSVEKKYSRKDVNEKGTIKYNLALDTEYEVVSIEIEATSNADIFPLPATLVDGTRNISVATHLCGMETEETKVYEGTYTLRTHLEMTNYESINADVVGKVTLSPKFGTEMTKDIYLRDFSETGTLDYETVFNSPGDYYSFVIEPVGEAELLSDSVCVEKTPDYDIFSTYNHDGTISRSEYYDLNGNRTLTDEGVFAYEYEYDDNGNAIVVRYYDTNNSPVISSDGYAEVHRAYNKLKYLTHESYYGEDGAPLANQMGYASFDQEVDALGRPTYIRYNDEEGKPTITGYKYAAVKKKYNDENLVIYEAYYDENGDRLSMEEGYSGCRYDYDKTGHRSKIVYLDDEDEPVITRLGYAEINKEFDDKGNITVESYYDENGELKLLDEGYATIVRIYDDYGDNTSVLYFGLETTSYVEIRREYDDQRRLIYEGKFDNDRNGLILNDDYSAYRLEYDDAGNVISVKYYGTDGNPMLVGGDYFECRRKYDENGRVIYESFWGIEGENVVRGGGYHGLGYGYDDNNNRNVIKYYDTYDNPVEDSTGVFEIRRTFDDNHNIINKSYYDLEGKLIKR
ncbi:oligosaccharide repeat unit polymerase [Butyrivibrio sp. XB500-5]|uniref:oligosaccharide repeat unit polymerase n=1 Tax=Butyrivibrio sp. XB500-5 TaxID=2364880 RepID=UPI0011C20FD2|nr:oligosaccharide repeat unit polymerase [Butyrivibrio sp. XB500-5]